MPELPEVETICQGLRTSIIGKRIEHAETMRPNLRTPFPDDMCERIEGTIVNSSDKMAIIKSGAIGWRVFLGPNTLDKIQKNNLIMIYRYYMVKGNIIFN